MLKFCKVIFSFTLFVIVFFSVSLLAGCNDQNRCASGVKICSSTPDLSSPAGMIDYLTGSPAVLDLAEWQNEFGPGITITSEHYEIHTTMLEPLTLSRVPAFMESAYSAYLQQLPYKINTHHKFTVYLFESREQWENFTREITGEAAEMYLKIKRGGYYLNGVCVTYNIGRARTFSVLGHEGWHQFNSRHFKYRLPSWLDEGIATLFESSEYNNGFFTFTPWQNGSRLGSLRKLMTSGKIIPLDKLIRLNPGEVVAHAEAEALMAFYAQSYALIRFLKEEEYGKHLCQYQQLLLDAKEGRWPIDNKLSKTAFDRNIPITSEWNRYVSPKLFERYIDNCDNIQQKYIYFCRKLVHDVRVKRVRQSK